MIVLVFEIKVVEHFSADVAKKFHIIIPHIILIKLEGLSRLELMLINRKLNTKVCIIGYKIKYKGPK